MAHTCTCTHRAAYRPIRAEQTVGEVVHQPGALDVMQRLGINHCCGAQLTLSEAAAAAGVALETLLAELNTCERARA
jgi:iron-sulfur cluster repair protein YtfE (RIC family)